MPSGSKNPTLDPILSTHKMSSRPTQKAHNELTIETKHEEEHVEDQDMEAAKAGVRDVQYDDQEGGEASRKGLRRMLRRNPSYEFIREVALADEEPLDPVQVSRLEKRLFWMIVPALCIDYIFYYVDKT
jgi:hypothetical protein